LSRSLQGVVAKSGRVPQISDSITYNVQQATCNQHTT